MTIKPVRTYTTPAYPTYQESKQDAHLLERLPRRWGKTLAPLLGTGILIQIVGTGCNSNDAQGKGVKITAVEPLGQKPKNVADAVRAIPVTRVAPILEDALANDGKGSFGCMAVSAPVFLSENEAMDLIRAELEKAGLALQPGVSVDGLQVPTTSEKIREEKKKKIENAMKKSRDVYKETWDKLHIANLVEGSYTFDLGTEDKSVVVKFFRTEDYDQWRDNHLFGKWSVESFNLSWLASHASDAFKARTNGNPVVIGLFFDPLTYPKSSKEKWQEIRKRMAEQKEREGRENWTEYMAYEKQVEAATKVIAHEKLRRQVLHFVEYLKKEGVVQ